MDKPEARDQTIKNVLDYTKAARYIDTVLGYSQRDAANKYGSGGDTTRPYLDYWHYFIDLVGVERNDTYCRGTFSFLEIYRNSQSEHGNDDWKTKIAYVWATEYPGRYTLWMSW